ncbi:MAG: prepilin-type N-terminal cleavage/methylation domain-containing protein [Pseudomonadota bacterium]
MQAQREKGFSALELLVAVAVLAVAFLPILAIQSQMLSSYERQAAAFERLTLGRNALAVLEDLNPMATPNGELAIGDGAVMRWRARARSEEARSTGFPIGDGPFSVRLYAVDVTVDLDGTPNAVAFTIERVGWRLVDVGPQNTEDFIP